MSSMVESLKKKSQNAAETADLQQLDTLIPAGVSEVSASPAIDKPGATKSGAGIKKKNLPKYESGKEDEGKKAVTIYLRESLAEQLEEHRWQGRWKSTTKLLEHIIEEYYKKL